VAATHISHRNLTEFQFALERIAQGETLDRNTNHLRLCVTSSNAMITTRQWKTYMDLLGLGKKQY